MDPSVAFKQYEEAVKPVECSSASRDMDEAVRKGNFGIMKTKAFQYRDVLATFDSRLGEIDSALRARPDTSSVTELVARANEESERRNSSQLDEAMATFAELIMGRGAQYSQQQPPPPPRPAQRRAARAKAGAVKSQNGASASDLVGDDPDD